MATTEATEIVPTSQLRNGDVVLLEGMRIRISRGHTLPPSKDGALPVYHFTGDVLNYDELQNSGNPILWCFDPEDGWNVQGNDLAHWTRVRTNLDKEATRSRPASTSRLPSTADCRASSTSPTFTTATATPTGA